MSKYLYHIFEKELNRFEEDFIEKIKSENEDMKARIEGYKSEIRNLKFENEFLKHKNKQYREEIWNHELKKV